MTVIHVTTSTHGRVLVEDAAVSPSAGVILAFHGYGERADDVLAQVNQIPGAAAWLRVAPQALHRFYSRRHERVVASWMTREDRELAIADNIAYVQEVLRLVCPARGDDSLRLIVLGFSQGAAMAYRVALLGDRPVSRIVAVAGDMPPEVKGSPREWPPVLVGAGTRDEWFSPRLAADLAFLQSRGVQHEVVRYDGGHEWTEELRQAIAQWLART